MKAPSGTFRLAFITPNYGNEMFEFLLNKCEPAKRTAGIF